MRASAKPGSSASGEMIPDPFHGCQRRTEAMRWNLLSSHGIGMTMLSEPARGAAGFGTVAW